MAIKRLRNCASVIAGVCAAATLRERGPFGQVGFELRVGDAKGGGRGGQQLLQVGREGLEPIALGCPVFIRVGLGLFAIRNDTLSIATKLAGPPFRAIDS